MLTLSNQNAHELKGIGYI